MFLTENNRFEIRTLQFPFTRRELSPLSRYYATNFRTYDPIKIKVEAFSFDLRPVSSFMTMR